MVPATRSPGSELSPIPGATSLRTEPSQGQTGSYVRLVGTGFSSGRLINLYWSTGGQSGALPRAVVTDEHGSFELPFTIPRVSTDGPLNLQACEDGVGVCAQTVFTIGTLRVGAPEPTARASAARGQPIPEVSLLQTAPGEYLSPHFRLVLRDPQNPFATQEVLLRIAQYLEASYTRLVVQLGFPPPRGTPVRVFLGAITPSNTNSAFAGIEGINWSEVGLGAEASGGVAGQAAHEFFHVIQASNYGIGPSSSLLPGGGFIETAANWAAAQVFPASHFWSGMGFELLSNPDAASLEGSKTGATLFWIYLTDRYGHALMDSIHRHLGNTDLYGALQESLGSMGTTLEEAFFDFAAMAFGGTWSRLPQGSILAATHIPSPALAAQVTWTGRPITLDAYPARSVKVEGHPLRLRNLYGADYLEITPTSDQPLAVTLLSEADSGLRAGLVGVNAQGASWERLSPGSPLRIAQGRSARLGVLVVKTNLGSGRYRLKLDLAP